MAIATRPSKRTDVRRKVTIAVVILYTPVHGKSSSIGKARILTPALGTTREMVDYYERRAINPALEVVRGCAKALNVSVIELLGSEDNANGRKETRNRPYRQDEAVIRSCVTPPALSTTEACRRAGSLRQSTRHSLIDLI